MTQFVHVITANALLSGKVVWLSEGEGWATDLRHAQTFTDQDEATAALARAQTRTGIVVGCYLVQMRLTAAGPEPLHFRESFRRDGPSAAARVPGN